MNWPRLTPGDAHLREGPGADAEVIDLIPAGTMMIVNGETHGASIPVSVPTRALEGSLVVYAPAEPTAESPLPPEDVMLGWVWEDYLDVTGRYAMVGRHGVNMRHAPMRDAALIGKVMWGYMVTIVGPVDKRLRADLRLCR